MKCMLLILCIFALPLIGGAAGDDLTLVTRQFCDLLVRDYGSQSAQAAGYLATLKADGSWGDLDYHSTQRAVWPTGSHLSRILTMALAWKHAGTSAELAGGIHRALGYWIAHDFQCPNWWYNQIGGPQALLSSGLLLGDELQPEERRYLIDTVLPRTKIGMTGQNKVWLAGNTLMGGLLQRDEALVKQAAEVIFAEIVVTTQEGIQPDFSFHQHGPQQQFGNYGLAFAGEMVKWAAVLHGSAWAMPAEKLGIFRRYLLDGERWACWRGKMDISACGRQLAPGSPAAKNASLTRVLTAMRELDPEYAKDYAAAADANSLTGENTLVGNKYFWRSDYMLHRRPAWCATLKMCSSRVIGSESLNSENLSGYYLADGALYLYRTGGEYTDIFPVWDWRRLPGVTCPQGDAPPPHFSNSRLATSFAGGVSDGVNGCAALDYQRDGVSAKKAWFFAGDQVMCLGAGIGATEKVTAPIATSVNQCRLTGAVRMCAGGKESTVETVNTHADDLAWVEHDGIRYSFPMKARVVINRGPQSGNWSAVLQTGSTPKAEQTQPVFSLWIEHGTQPKDDAYAYIMQPITPTRPPEPEILQNSAEAQVVRFDGHLVQAVCYAPTALKLTAEHSLSVTSPCLLLVDTATTPPRLFVADPTQTLASLSVTYDGKTVEVTLPKGGAKGKSTNEKFKM